MKINVRFVFFFSFSDGEEDEDDEGISERSLRRTPSDDGKKNRLRVVVFKYILIASQDSDYCTEDLILMNETDVW